MAEAPTSPAGGNESGGEQSPQNGSSSTVREQDRYLPIANISRIMKKALPPNGKIAKDAKDTVQECVSEFISFVTSEASDKCQKEKRKTINGDDLLWAMATLGFEEYIEPLRIYLARYRELEGDWIIHEGVWMSLRTNIKTIENSRVLDFSSDLRAYFFLLMSSPPKRELG
ncbi:nuclear transcription factor Y subunit B-1-like isoform X2 [Argentina anserina]|uniref:nuclear transcription factor Y subunit B-1-like isoform X2 n=1 Tax=Argentina anserina TaxID=57926 RepID=UPI0021761D70|nr:nuclear transcription factor Y subunit B-1-like isoform X2 [Potentilla anserina]